jgi:hypothetical protein
MDSRRRFNDNMRASLGGLRASCSDCLRGEKETANPVRHIASTPSQAAAKLCAGYPVLKALSPPELPARVRRVLAA